MSLYTLPLEESQAFLAQKISLRGDFAFRRYLLNCSQNRDSRHFFQSAPYNGMTSLWTGKGPSVSIRFKVILPYLLLTLIVAVTGAYIVTRLVSSSLNERLTNQLIEAGRVISDTMARQEVKQLESARLIAYTRGLGDAIQAGNMDQAITLAQPSAGGSNVENLMIFDAQGHESVHLIKQADRSIPSVTQPGRPTT